MNAVREIPLDVQRQLCDAAGHPIAGSQVLLPDFFSILHPVSRPALSTMVWLECGACRRPYVVPQAEAPR